jgi:hypothetical protein
MSKVKSSSGAVFMKFGTFGLFLTRNRMKKVVGLKNDPLKVIMGVKGQHGQKWILVVKYLVGNLYDFGNSPK